MFILWNTQHSLLDISEFENLRKSNLAASSDFKWQTHERRIPSFSNLEIRNMTTTWWRRPESLVALGR